ncbi:hypothetical protein AJ79_07728 [Helicocarpus griseus UAMH5409]|uniref:Glucose N-acetyltransferase 1 n=1 Tax=Helicocarpus griseus UAMH5409 TaxID=1447875 RepID=A0A2B7WZX6_9EURO|nr:hypothetical protein AJ79_07728 [Helicocarpus griseus UAMH5409]
MAPNLLQSVPSRPARTAIVVFFIIFLIANLQWLSRYTGQQRTPLAGEASVNQTTSRQNQNQIDWSRFAYAQYATNADYLCNSVMLFQGLDRLGSKADRMLMYPSRFSAESKSVEGNLLRKALEYDVNLVPIQVQKRDRDYTWGESYTKLLAFNQTQYDRVLVLDSDSTITKPMDELFLLPPSPVAMPRAYWMDPHDFVMTSALMLIEPSEFEFKRIEQSISEALPHHFDMEIVNDLYNNSALILPHRPYILLTGEFRNTDHIRYMGNSLESWDPEKILWQAKFVHFSDWPVPKPWISAD